MKKRKYFLGGEMQLLQLGTSLASSFDQSTPSNVPDLAKMLKGGLAGAIPELIKWKQERDRLASHVGSASPGNYRHGGPVTPPDSLSTLPKLFPQVPVPKVPGQSQVPYPILILSEKDLPSKSKSKTRLREYQFGGQMISDSALQVTGNPNKVDGNYINAVNAFVDYGEMLKNNFVFSDTLKRRDGKTFAEAVVSIERSTGKLEKQLKTTPNDPIVANTINMNNKQVKKIATEQETLANSLGLRNNSRKYATGGPIYPQPNQPFIYLGNDYYYDPYSSTYARRNLNGSYTAEQNSPYDWFERQGDSIRVKLPNPIGAARKTSYVDINAHLKKYPANMQENLAVEQRAGFLPEFAQEAPTTQRPRVPARRATKQQGVSGNRQILPPAVVNDLPVSEEEIIAALGQGTSPQTNDDRASRTVSPAASTTSATLGDVVGQQRSLETFQGASMPVTAGDVLQGLEVFSKFGMLANGYEQSKANTDSTAITRQVYDSTGALRQNQLNFNLAQNSLNGASINQNRTFNNNLYAKKLEADNQVRSNYQNMNAQALAQYEQRTSDQRRFNAGQLNYTQDLNARDRGAYYTAVDRAFNSLGNFGQSMNAKRQSADVLNILQASYPDVYARLMSQHGK